MIALQDLKHLCIDRLEDAKILNAAGRFDGAFYMTGYVVEMGLKKVVLELEKEHGAILIFALFLREDPLGKWDIVVSAPWLDANDVASYKIIDSKLKETLSSVEIMELARIVLLDVKDPVVSFLQDTLSVTNGHFEEISGEPFSSRFGFTIKRSYVLRCRKDL